MTPTTTTVTLLGVITTTAVLTVLSSSSAHAQTLADIQAKLNQVEGELSELASAAEAMLQNRYTTIAECRSGGSRGCSVPSCSENFPTNHGFQCLASGYGNATGVCGGTTCGNGLIRSMNESVVSVPPDSSFSSASAEAFLCATKSLDSSFAEKASSGNLTGFQYVAERYGGAVRVFPGFPQERGQGFCGNYDVRLRSWFVTAMSGKKEVVIVYDKSGSMARDAGFEGLSRMTAVKNSVIRLLQTLTLDDRVGLVRFNSQAVSHTGDSLVQATPKTVEKLTEEVRQVSAGGGTSFGTGIETAFNLLADSESPCTPVILFLTDGEATDGDAVFTAIAKGQEKLASLGKKTAYIHTYSMGSGADDKKPKQMACGNEGVWYPISAGEDPLKQMSQYYKFLADSAVSTKIRWSAPYEDALGGGLTITAARSLVDRSDPNAPVVLGVVATDVNLGTEFTVNQTENALLESDLTNRGECIVKSVTFCNLQTLRAEVGNGFQCDVSYAKAGDTTSCEDVSTTSTTTVSLPNINNLLCEELNTTTRVPKTQRRAYPYSTKDVSCCSTTSVGGILTGAQEETVTTAVPHTTTTAPSGFASASSSMLVDSSAATSSIGTTTTTPTPQQTVSGCALSATVNTSSSSSSSSNNLWNYQVVSACAPAKACVSTLCSCNGGTPQLDSLNAADQPDLAVTMNQWCRFDNTTTAVPACATVEKCLWEFNKCVGQEVATATAAPTTSSTSTSVSSTACAAWGSQLKSSFTAILNVSGEAIFSERLVQDCERFACQTTNLFAADTCASEVTTCNVGCTRLQLPDPKPSRDDGSDGTVLTGDNQFSRSSGGSSHSAATFGHSIISCVLVVFLVGFHAGFAMDGHDDDFNL